VSVAINPFDPFLGVRWRPTVPARPWLGQMPSRRCTPWGRTTTDGPALFSPAGSASLSPAGSASLSPAGSASLSPAGSASPHALLTQDTTIHDFHFLELGRILADEGDLGHEGAFPDKTGSERCVVVPASLLNAVYQELARLGPE
jgi:hypothetical protein